MGKTKKNQKTYTKKRLNSIILLLAFAAIMLIVSTYAWFSTQKNVTIANLAGTVQVAEGMEISLDGEHFKQTLDLSQVDWTRYSGEGVTNFGDYPVYQGNTNNIPDELQPVSTDGAVTASMSDLTFYKGTYTTNDETLKGVVACEAATNDATSKVGKIQFTAAVGDEYDAGDEIPAGYITYPGYYAFDMFIKSTIQDTNAGAKEYNIGTSENPVNVKGTPLQLNYDSFAKILEKVTGDGNKINTIDWENNVSPEDLDSYTSSGLQGTVRVGFAVYDKVASSTPSAGEVVLKTVTGETVNEVLQTPYIRQIAIWEPNSAYHVDAIVTELGQLVLWDDQAASIVTDSNTNAPLYNSWGNASQIVTYGVTSSAASHDISKIYSWDQDFTNSADYTRARTDGYLAIQNTVKTRPVTEKTGEGTAQSPYVYTRDYSYLHEGIVNLYDTSVDVQDTSATKQDFWIQTDHTSRVRVFLWIEGQDVDTRNAASFGHGVQVNIDLTTGETIGRGLGDGQEEIKAIYDSYDNLDT